jgi:hypothetical protein
MDWTEIAYVGSLLLCGMALGAMVFFAAVIAPIVFRSLPADIAGGFIRGLFPVYYSVLLGVTAIAALGLWGRQEALVLAVVAGLFAFARWGLMPRINRARDLERCGDAQESRIFSRLHRLSVIVNTVQMVALLAVFLRLAGV